MQLTKVIQTGETPSCVQYRFNGSEIVSEDSLQKVYPTLNTVPTPQAVTATKISEMEVYDR
jgi:hypothetical protein